MAALKLREISQITSTVGRYRNNKVSSIIKQLCQLSCHSISSRVMSRYDCDVCSKTCFIVQHCEEQ